LGLFLNDDAQPAVGDGHRRDPHVLAHDHGAGALVDDDPGDSVDRDFDRFEPGHVFNGPAPVLIRDFHAHRPGVSGHGRGPSDLAVYGPGEILGRREIRLLEHELQAVLKGQRGRRLFFHKGAGRDGSNGGVVHLSLGASGPGRKPADGNRPLGEGVDFSVDSLKLGEQKGASLKTFGVSDGGDERVQAHAGPGKSRQLGRDHDGRHVFHLDLVRIHGDAHFGEHVGQALDGELGSLLVS